MSEKVLCVDDDENILAGYQRNLRKRFALEAAVGGEDALQKVRTKGPYAVVVADMKMPGMNGIELLAQIREAAPDTIRIMLTGNADLPTAVDAINRGHIFRFLNKPCSPDMLALTIEAGLNQYRLVMAERELLEGTLSGSVKMLTEILSMVEPQFFGRGQMLRDYLRALAPLLKITHTWDLEVAAMVCQIGYVTVPAAIIHKDRTGVPVSATEQQILTRIPEIGAKLLSHIPRLESVARVVLYQNKCFDGSGYPHDAIAGASIPLGSRILRVLSDFIELEIAGTPKTDILNQMRKRTGRYDSTILEAAFTALVEDAQKVESGQAVKVKDLVPGQVLISPVFTNDGVLIVPAGTKVSPMLLEKLSNFAAFSGVKEPVYVSGTVAAD
jgi:response regulator RpfG family c-di-GMP phosphodiesterase